MIRHAVVLAVVTCAVAASSAQAPVDLPRFEVASVKPNVSTGAGQSGRSFRGSVTLINMPLRLIVANAFAMRPANVLGGPDWIDSERFDINARAPENASDDQLDPMLRSLLAERFRLVARTETREQPIFALVLARDDGRLGPSLHASTECRKGAATGADREQSQARLACGVRISANATMVTVQGGAVPMNSVARALDGTSGRRVIDGTGLAGTFDLELRYAQGDPQPTTGVNDVPTVFTALQEQLGLKLEPARGPVEVLVIDSVERPTPD